MDQSVDLRLTFSSLLMNTSHIRRKWLDIPYASKSQTQKLDIYLPNEGDGPFPVIASIHGGGWMFGDKGDEPNRPFLEALKRGYAVACVNYRLSDEAYFPSQIQDCRTAIRFLRTNAPAYHLDGARIGAWGASAGGHLAALLGTADKVRGLDDPSMRNIHTRFSGKVQAVVVWYGPVADFLTMDDELNENGLGPSDHSDRGSPESRLLGRKIADVPALVKFASPMTYVRRKIPPFLLQHGLKDDIVPVQQSIRFAERIKKVAGQDRVTLEFLENATHGDPLFETPHNIQRVLNFFDLHLK
ncbi:MAG: alpha/beta hydrolase [Chloroflexota bacterium]